MSFLEPPEREGIKRLVQENPRVRVILPPNEPWYDADKGKFAFGLERLSLNDLLLVGTALLAWLGLMSDTPVLMQSVVDAAEVVQQAHTVFDAYKHTNRRMFI